MEDSSVTYTLVCTQSLYMLVYSVVKRVSRNLNTPIPYLIFFRPLRSAETWKTTEVGIDRFQIRTRLHKGLYVFKGRE